MPKEVIQPRIRGFIATNAHPAGCRESVRAQIATTQALGTTQSGMNVLIIGASTGYGLAARIVAAFGFGADTLGVFYERPPAAKRTATAGYYNSVAFHSEARQAGRAAYSLNGDAFSDEIKSEALGLIREHLGPIDILIYSLASPRRKHPKTGLVHNSVLKPTERAFTSKTINLNTGEVAEITLEPATGDEVADTREVMGGEDFAMWVDALLSAGLFQQGARAVTFSYIGPALTHPIYRSGTIGRAKQHLEATARSLDARMQAAIGGHVYASVNKGVITQASAAIPVVPLYMSMLYPVMREAGTHEGPIDQMNRLFRDHLAAGRTPSLDEEGRIRLDERELAGAIQAEIERRWARVTTENLSELADFAGFQREFRQLFGFDLDGVDYAAPTEIDLAIE